MDRIELLHELAHRVDLADARGDWEGKELFAAAWLRIHHETDAQHAVSGLARRIAAREAAKPLDARIIGAGSPTDGIHYVPNDAR